MDHGIDMVLARWTMTVQPRVQQINRHLGHLSNNLVGGAVSAQPRLLRWRQKSWSSGCRTSCTSCLDCQTATLPSTLLGWPESSFTRVLHATAEKTGAITVNEAVSSFAGQLWNRVPHKAPVEKPARARELSGR